MSHINDMDISDLLDEWGQPVILHRCVVVVNVNGNPVPQFQDLEIEAVVQPASRAILSSDLYDKSLRYLLVHSKTEIKMGDEMTHNGQRYKAKEVGPWQDYGYSEVIFEELKQGRTP